MRLPVCRNALPMIPRAARNRRSTLMRPPHTRNYGNKTMDLQLTGRTALVTGASRGIGRAIAHELANEGCHLHLASRSAADLEKVRAEIAQKHRVQIQCHALDLGESRNIATLVERAGAVDILVN